jgi:formylmethanofuran dehydrogenase subunit E
MRVEIPKLRKYTSELEEKGIEFHGHGGPFMVVGLRMGLAALRALDAFGWFGISCKAFLLWSPPDSCVIDGIQVSTGCTMGKHNIEVVEEPDIAAEFSYGDKWIRIQLRGEELLEIKEIFDHGDDAVREYMDNLVMVPDSRLFIIEFKNR